MEDGVLRLNGPVFVENSVLSRRATSWNNEFAVLYLDQPIGTGFSYATVAAERVEGYARDQADVSAMLLDFLSKWYDTAQLWPRANDLFITGESRVRTASCVCARCACA